MKKSLFLGLVTCFIGMNMAFAQNSPTPSNDRDDRHDREDVRFQCNFKGFYQKKDQLNCTAYGEIDKDVRDHNEYIRGDRDDHLTVVCGDRIVYSDGVIYGFFDDRHDRHDGPGPSPTSTMRPANDDHRRDREFDVKLLSAIPFVAAIEIKDVKWRDLGPYPATLAVNLSGYGINNGANGPANLVGSCSFHPDARRPHGPSAN